MCFCIECCFCCVVVDGHPRFWFAKMLLEAMTSCCDGDCDDVGEGGGDGAGNGNPLKMYTRSPAPDGTCQWVHMQCLHHERLLDKTSH